MKKLWLILLVIPVLFCCGFLKKSRPKIILSTAPITSNNAQVIENNFRVNSRIYYSLYAPDGFKYSGVRMQISKQDEKVSNWGFSIRTTRDININDGEKVYNNYMYLTQKGHYILQFFYLNNKDYPFAHREFRVY